MTETFDVLRKDHETLVWVCTAASEKEAKQLIEILKASSHAEYVVIEYGAKIRIAAEVLGDERRKMIRNN